MGRETITVCVQRDGDDGLATVFLYRMLEAGVCGPWSEPVLMEVPVGDFGPVDRWVRERGYVRTGDFQGGKLVCEAPVMKVA